MEYDNPLKAYIDLGALRNNLDCIKRKFPGKRIILPVKANAYGHGDCIVAKEAEKCGVDFFAIARVSEGIKLRNAGITSRIMTLGVELGENIDLAFQYDIELAVNDCENIREIGFHARHQGKMGMIHLDVDTGMARLGCNAEEILEVLAVIKEFPELHFASVFTHFAKSDEDQAATEDQSKFFGRIHEIIEKSGVKPDFYHMYNSGGVENLSGESWCEAMRPGIMVYGYSQKIDRKDNDGLIPVMTLAAPVMHIQKKEKGTGVGYGHTYQTTDTAYLATLPAGYGDGLMRAFSNKLDVGINGTIYHERGRLSMDLMVVEVDENVHRGDLAFIFGNKKYAAMDAEDVALICNTISYEITTHLGDRVARIPVENIDQLSVNKEVRTSH